MRYHGLGLSSLAFSLGFKGYPIFPVFMLDWALVMLFGVALRRHTFIQHIYLAVKKKKFIVDSESIVSRLDSLYII